MTTQHTPAPWKFNSCDQIFSTATNESVATIHTIYIDDDVAQANARLIAAAPLMLEALELWSKFMINKNIPHELVIATREAINAAKGN